MIETLLLISIVGWGVRGVFDKRALASGSIPAVALALYAFNLPVAFILACYLAITKPGWHVDQSVVLLSCAVAACQFLAMCCYLKAMTLTEASFVLGITAAYPLVSQIVAVTFLGEQFLPLRCLGAVLISLGVFVISSARSSASNDAKTAGQGSPDSADTKGKSSILGSPLLVLCVLTATILWGVVGILDKMSVGHGAPCEVYFVRCMCYVVCLIVALLGFGYVELRPQLTSRPMWSNAGLSCLTSACGNAAYLCAMSLSQATYVIAITACYPVVMYAAAVLFLKENFCRLRGAGVMLIVAGGLVTQLTKG